MNRLKRTFEKLKQWFLYIVRLCLPDKCEHEFEGLYNIRASNETVEMNCKHCGKLSAWTFDEFEKIENKA